jgi:hypothetical protein
MEDLNDIKCIVNEKDWYIDGKNMKIDMRCIPKLQEASQTKVVVGVGRGGVNCAMSNSSCVAISYTCCNANNEY